MAETDDIDLLITDDDLTLDAIGIPVLVTGRACIVQDIRNMLREKGYLIGLMGQRDMQQREVITSQVEQEVENDVRIVPGTARITEINPEKYILTATSMRYGPLQLELMAG